ILVAVGADPMPDAVNDYKLPTLAQAIHKNLAAWADGSALKQVLSSLRAAPKPNEPPHKVEALQPALSAKTVNAAPTHKSVKTQSVKSDKKRQTTKITRAVKPVKPVVSANIRKIKPATLTTAPKITAPVQAAASVSVSKTEIPSHVVSAATTTDSKPVIERIARFFVDSMESSHMIASGYDPMHHE
ncbi:MAG: hypothetical protein WCF85_18040, partial [Rhodospirillaceae bacterium]